MRYIALLRGINVGGNTMIKMEELRKAFEALGFERVVSYINSGNLAFDVRRESALRKPGLQKPALQKPALQKPARSKGTEDADALQKPARSKGTDEVETELISQIQAAIEKAFAKSIPVMIREQTDILRIIEANPFAGEFESHKEMHVLFLRDEMPRDKQTQLLEAATPPERFAVIGREIYCHLPMGVADSILGKSFIEKKLKLAVTGRNWRTVEKLSTL